MIGQIATTDDLKDREALLDEIGVMRVAMRNATEEICALQDQLEAAERRYAIECANHKATIQLLNQRRQRIERLRGMLKTNAGWWYADGNEDRWAECMKAAGDIETMLDAAVGPLAGGD